MALLSVRAGLSYRPTSSTTIANALTAYGDRSKKAVDPKIKKAERERQRRERILRKQADIESKAERLRSKEATKQQIKELDHLLMMTSSKRHLASIDTGDSSDVTASKRPRLTGMNASSSEDDVDDAKADEEEETMSSSKRLLSYTSEQKERIRLLDNAERQREDDEDDLTISAALARGDIEAKADADFIDDDSVYEQPVKMPVRTTEMGVTKSSDTMDPWIRSELTKLATSTQWDDQLD